MSATSDTTEIIMETVSRATSFLSATRTKDSMLTWEHVFVLMELSLSGENARKFLSALPTHTTTPSAASATQDSNSTHKTSALLLSMLSSLSALPTQDSTESHALATLEYSNNPSTPAPPAPQELNGTDRSVTRSLPRPVLMAMFSTRTSTTVSLQLLHVETMPISTELPVFA